MMQLDSSLNFELNRDKCIKCGLCVKECLFGVLSLEEYPEIKDENSCLRCQHCFAVCPTGAISMEGSNPEEISSYKGFVPDYEQMKKLVLTRRAIRHYKDENVDKETITDLCETALHSPTGKNTGAVHFTVVHDKAVLKAFKQKVYAKLLNNDFVNMPGFEVLSTVIDLYKKNAEVDVIFGGAPHIIVASVDENAVSPEADPFIALSSFEMLANSKQLGTLWTGFLKYIIDDVFPELKKELQLPESHKIGYVMAFGKPAVKFQRAVNRESINNIHFVKS